MPFPAELVNAVILRLAELHFVAVIHVGHQAPGSLAHHLALRQWHTKLRRALLELDGVASGGGGHLDQFFGHCEVAIVVDADFGDDITRLSGADLLVAQLNRAGIALRNFRHALSHAAKEIRANRAVGRRCRVKFPAAEAAKPGKCPKCKCTSILHVLEIKKLACGGMS